MAKKVSKKVLEQLVKESGGRMSYVAEALGVHWNTADKKVREYKDLAKVFDEVKELRVKRLVSKATDIIEDELDDGNVAVAFFVLKTQAGWHERPKEESGGGGLVINLNFAKVPEKGLKSDYK